MWPSVAVAVQAIIVISNGHSSGTVGPNYEEEKKK